MILRAFSITSFSAWHVESFLVSTKLCALAITFPFLSYQIFEWFCKAKENRKVTVLVGNFKQKHFVSTDVLYKAPCKKNTLLLHSNESNNLRAMNFFHVPFECRSILETSQRVDSVAHILSAEGTHVCVLPQYFMAYEGLIYRSLLDKEYCEYMYRIQNRTNSTMEFYYLWKLMNCSCWWTSTMQSSQHFRWERCY